MISLNDNSNIETLVFQALRLCEDFALVQFLYDENPIVYSAAARALQIRGSKVAFDAAIELTEKPDAERRNIGCFMLGQIGKDRPFKAQSIPLLIHHLVTDESIEVRAQCAAALGHLKADEAAPTLIVAAREQSADVRASVAAAIGHLTPSRELRESLRVLLGDDDGDVREWAEISEEIYSEKSQLLP
jgi:HEAT repeat protein